MNHLHEAFEYDHIEGCLRWKAPDDSEDPAVSHMSRAKPGSVAGRRGIGEYKVKHRREMHCGLRMVWQHVTGELTMSKVRTMNPRDMTFRIDNLYLVPFDQVRVHQHRARNSTVVSYCFERKQYTVVDVDHSYNKLILSYHDVVDDAIKALNKPEVSFL